jgi:peptidoglycan hydrolase CwlO-like protein
VAFSLIFLSLLPLIVFSNFVSKGIVYAATSTKQSINDAQQKQDEINAQIDNIKKDIASVSKKKNKLSGSLSWLNDRSDEQRQLYEQKLEELDATMQALADSNEAYINAMNDLSNKKELYKKRLQAMFSYKRNSYLEWFLESGSLKNYFTMVQFMQIVAESDQQILDDLQASADDAELKKQNLEKQKSELSAITNNITLQIEKLKSDINTTQAQLQSIQDNLNSWFGCLKH